MPEKATLARAKKDLKQGKSASTAAGEFVREEIEHVREGKHGARSAKQAIAIGLSKARRAGIKLKPPGKGTSTATKKAAARDAAKGRSHTPKKTSPTRARAAKKALRKEPHRAASKRALAAHATKAAGRRTAAQRSASARKAAATRKRNAAKA